MEKTFNMGGHTVAGVEDTDRAMRSSRRVTSIVGRWELSPGCQQDRDGGRAIMVGRHPRF